MPCAIRFLVCAMLLATGCNDRTGSSTKRTRSAASIEAIPADVSYSIIETETVPRVKRSLDVRLNKKVWEDTLELIATAKKID